MFFRLVIKYLVITSEKCRYRANMIYDLDRRGNRSFVCSAVAKQLTGEVGIRVLILFAAVRAGSAPSRLRGSVEISETRRLFTSY